MTVINRPLGAVRHIAIPAQRQTPPVYEQLNCNCDNFNAACRRSSPVDEEALAVLGHEIRNPLSALSHALEAWPSSTEDPQVTEDLLQIMRRQVTQLIRLSNDLLDTGRSAQGSLRICPTVIDLRKAILDACEQVRPFAERCGHAMTMKLSDPPIMLLGDESRLIQVFANLLHNAAKFTDRGGHLEISLEREQGVAVIRVNDNGRGIAKDKLQSTFQPLKVPKQCSETLNGGLGIGLRLVKAIVELHGGTVEVFSEGLGYGSTFAVRLPLKNPLRLSMPTPSSQRIEAVCNSGSRLSSYRIVVVDDDRSMTFLMSRLLQSLGQSVSVASSGESAIETASRLQPQVIFLDLQMQGMSGYEVARHLRERAELKNVVLIALSGHADDASRRLATDCGFDRYLVKPTSIAQLNETLRDVEPLIKKM